MNFVKQSLILLLVIFLGGCSYVSFNTQSKQYLSAKSIPPLKMPPGTSSNAFHSYYPVSSKQYPLSVEDVSLVPPGLMDNEK